MSVNFLKHAIKTKSTSVFAPLMSLFVQLTANPGDLRGQHSEYFATRGDVEKQITTVEGMIATLRTNFENSLANYTHLESEAETTWAALDAQLAADISDLEDEIETLRGHIAEMNECVTEE